MIKLYIALFILSMMAAIGYAGKYYYDSTQATIATLRENNVKLVNVAETLQNTDETMEADAKRNEELNRNLSKRLQQSSKHLDKLRGVLAKIDLTMEAIQDPEGLEERVNNAVNRLIKRIESETSPAPITADADGVSGESSGTDSSSKD